jgi:hypothetical protein
MKRGLAALALSLLLAQAMPAAAQSAGSQAECEKKYPNPMEFNLCLASLSPVRGRVTADKPPSGGRAVTGRSGRISTVRRGGRVSSVIYLGGSQVQRGSGGRKRITFDLRR